MYDNKYENQDYTKRCPKCGLRFVSVKHLRAHLVDDGMGDWRCTSASDLRKAGWKTKEINGIGCFYDPTQTARAEKERLEQEQALAQQQWEWQQAEAARLQHEEEVRLANLQVVKVEVNEEEFTWY